MTVYPYDSTNDEITANWTKYNSLKSATYGCGDAILETSISGKSTTSWNDDYSYFTHTSVPLFVRGGDYGRYLYAGIFAFSTVIGNSYYFYGFRAVLVCE